MSRSETTKQGYTHDDISNVLDVCASRTDTKDNPERAPEQSHNNLNVNKRITLGQNGVEWNHVTPLSTRKSTKRNMGSQTANPDRLPQVQDTGAQTCLRGSKDERQHKVIVRRALDISIQSALTSQNHMPNNRATCECPRMNLAESLNTSFGTNPKPGLWQQADITRSRAAG